jgi:hypothetical protein
MRQPCSKRFRIKKHPTARLGIWASAGVTAAIRLRKKSRSGIMAQWAPYVGVRVIGSVAPASRKQLIPTDRFLFTNNDDHLPAIFVTIPRPWVKIEQRDVSPQMSPRVPPLGSLAVQSSSQSSQLVHVSPATCHNLSLFKGSWRFFFSDVSASLGVWVLFLINGCNIRVIRPPQGVPQTG